MHVVQRRFIGAAVLMAGLAGIHSACRGQDSPDSRFSTRDKVGQVAGNRYYTPANQILAPATMAADKDLAFGLVVEATTSLSPAWAISEVRDND